MVKRMHKSLSLATAAALVMSTVSIAQADTVTLSVPTSTAKGSILAAVFASAEAFEKGTVSAQAQSPVVQGITEVKLEGLTAGTYGIALFQDLNGNGKLDRNLLGAPNEPFGFSKNPVIKFSAPKFESFQFQFDGTPLHFSITLNGA